MLLCMFSGKVIVYDTEKNEIRNHFEPGYQPIRCGRFIARKQWVVFGCDDLYVRVYNYNTGEKVSKDVLFSLSRSRSGERMMILFVASM